MPTLNANGRLTFQEQMKLTALPDITRDGVVVKRYMSRRAAWYPGCDLPPSVKEGLGPENPMPFRNSAAFGGHVYSQAGLAASRALRADQGGSAGGPPSKQPCIHTIHGFFSEAGAADRPFIYEVVPLAANASFPNFLVTARQPQQPSPGSDYYALKEAMALHPACFSAIISFRPPGPRQLSAQEPPARERFLRVLASRTPDAWDPAPLADVDIVTAALAASSLSSSSSTSSSSSPKPRDPGRFPLVDMRKVDLAAWNEGRPLHERRELLLYRLLGPLPAEGGGDGGDGPDAHILVHAFEADRNGLLMLGNHAGFGFDFGRAASLSYSFVVHVNPEDAVMRYRRPEEGGANGLDGWWIQEVCFPRLDAGRGVVLSKIWSPMGVHVATGYQDGIVQRSREARPGTEGRGKL